MDFFNDTGNDQFTDDGYDADGCPIYGEIPTGALVIGQ